MSSAHRRFSNTLNRFPFLGLETTLLVLRGSTALFFLAHAVVRISGGTVPQFGLFMERQGFSPGVTWVWCITAAELVAGSLMALGLHVRCAAAVLFTIAAGGIVLIHRHLGWFVGEHGTGGSEYSVALMVALLVVAAADRDAAGAGGRAR